LLFFAALFRIVTSCLTFAFLCSPDPDCHFLFTFAARIRIVTSCLPLQPGSGLSLPVYLLLSFAALIRIITSCLPFSFLCSPDPDCHFLFTFSFLFNPDPDCHFLFTYAFLCSPDPDCHFQCLLCFFHCSPDPDGGGEEDELTGCVGWMGLGGSVFQWHPAKQVYIDFILAFLDFLSFPPRDKAGSAGTS
jgi:hypothetical protein